MLELGNLRNWRYCPCRLSGECWRNDSAIVPVLSVVWCRGALGGLRASKGALRIFIQGFSLPAHSMKKTQEVKVDVSLNSAGIWGNRNLLWKLHLEDSGVVISLASAVVLILSSNPQRELQALSSSLSTYSKTLSSNYPCSKSSLATSYLSNFGEIVQFLPLQFPNLQNKCGDSSYCPELLGE